jgi:hypothetical protein
MSSLYPSFQFDNKATCDICHFARQRKLSFPISTSIATSKFELLHFDIWGPLATPSVHNHRYFLTILDDHSRFVWIILLKHKSEVPSHVQNFVTLIETQFHITPKTIRTDNGPEFLLPSYYASKGIIHHKSCVETPQQNGRVERKHQHLLNVGRALLYQSKLPKCYLSYAILHATFIINRVTTPVLHNKSPYQCLYGSLPSIDSFKVFGSLCYASTLQVHKTKLDSRARKSLFLGYTTGMKGYVLLDLHSREIFVSRHVIFHEHILPYQKSPSNPISSWTYMPSESPIIIDPPPPSNSVDPTPLPLITNPIVKPSPPVSHSLPTRRSSRQKSSPSYLQDYICNTSTAPKHASQSCLYPITN